MKKSRKLYHRMWCLKQLCCDDITKIENYDKAISSNERWDCHHRLETHFSDGTPRPVGAQLSTDELKALDMYYNRPTSELILLPYGDHTRLHLTGKVRYEMTDDIKSKISKSVKNNPDAMGSKAKRMRDAYNKDNKGLSWNQFQHQFKEMF